MAAEVKSGANVGIAIGSALATIGSEIASLLTSAAITNSLKILRKSPKYRETSKI